MRSIGAAAQRPIEGLFTQAVLEWCHDALDDLDWTFDRLCLGDHHPGIRVGAGWPLHPIGAGLRTLSGRDAPAAALTSGAQPPCKRVGVFAPTILANRAAKPRANLLIWRG